MIRFSHIEKKKSKAQKVFEDVKNSLMKCIQEYEFQIAQSHEEIDNCQKVIQQESEAIAHAKQEIWNTSETLKKVQNITG